MWEATRAGGMCFVVLGLGLVGLAVSATTTAQAGDLEPPRYGPAPYPAPNYGGMYEGGGPCRIVLDRRVDRYGREIVQRVRVCGPGAAYPEAPVVGPGYGYPAPRYYAPQPSGDYAPRPLAPVGPMGPGYYN
jgi:hypothetical protein